jgi:hypothetical protein
MLGSRAGLNPLMPPAFLGNADRISSLSDILLFDYSSVDNQKDKISFDKRSSLADRFCRYRLFSIYGYV